MFTSLSIRFRPFLTLAFTRAAGLRRLRFLLVIAMGVGSLVASTVQAQDRYGVGALPQLGYQKSLSQNYTLQTEFESRHFFAQGHFRRSDAEYEYEFSRADFSAVLSRALPRDNKVNAGYLIRFKSDGDVIHRIIQQFEIVGKYDAFQMSHRFAAEQMFATADKPEFRFRYRIGFKWPLGDPEGGTALKVKNEHLYGFQGSTAEYELRLGAAAEFEGAGGHTFSFGPEYRVSPLNVAHKSHQFLLALGYEFAH